MIYLLDTNACIHHLKFSNSIVTRKLIALHPSDIAVSSITKAELFYGAMRSNDPTQALRNQQEFLSQFVSLPFDDQASLIHGRIRAQLAMQGTPVGSYDLMIAAIALANNLVVVTHNTREFERIESLAIEDWEEQKSDS
ncbi:type II toxin-antitoxin system VapC family toxin [Oscillatoria amoena NRMC-F 0135]|nr:type II toxin-antitoxin system VapC family toxin [Geitlerinema splendidum]MDL5049992.1 type II toxin-antitoxin system VapC family toxin [Oscillatoria amoena NRMC-F 0135]